MFVVGIVEPAWWRGEVREAALRLLYECSWHVVLAGSAATPPGAGMAMFM